MTNLLRRFLDDESGTTAVEYGLIVTFIALVIISAVKPIGTKVTNKFGVISNSLS